MTTIPFTLIYVLHRHDYLGPWLQVALPFAFFLALHLLKVILWGRLLEVSWDGTGLRIRQAQDVAFIPWSEFAGHRFTWGLPGRLRIDRSSNQETVTFDIVGLDGGQRDVLLRELALHPVALPNSA